MHATWFLYRGVRYETHEHRAGGYRLRYDLHVEKGQWIAELDLDHGDADSAVRFTSPSRARACGRMEGWFDRVVTRGGIKGLMRRAWSVYLDAPEILLPVSRQHPFGYHITHAAHRASILAQGLIPAYDTWPEVKTASQLIDRHRPSYFPHWAARVDAVYASPDCSTERLADADYETARDLYAVRLIPKRCVVGSQGLGGLCLAAEGLDQYKDEVDRKKAEADLHRNARLYWEHAARLEELWQSPRHVRNAQRSYGLDEILIFHPVPASRVELLGTWDVNSHFTPTEAFFHHTRLTRDEALKRLIHYQQPRPSPVA